MSGHLDNKAFNLVQVRSSDQMGRPWTDYQNAYTYSATFYVSAGYHTFSILSTDACKESSTSVYDGDIHFSYWTRKVLPPKQVVQMMYSMKTLKPLIYVLLLSDIIVVIVVSVLIRFL